MDLLPPGEKRNDDYYDNLTTSAKLGYDFTDNFDVGLVARYTDAHIRVTDDDFSTFPSFPAAEQTHSNTTEYYARATGHLLSFSGFLDQTLGAAYTRKRTSTIEPVTPETLATGERIFRGACVGCHGEKGDGTGREGKYLPIPPRDFVTAQFLCRHTPSGSLPRDEDLFDTLTLGMGGAAMPWVGVLLAVAMIFVVLVDAFEVVLLPRRIRHGFRVLIFQNISLLTQKNPVGASD